MKKNISIEFLYIRLNWLLIQELYILRSFFKKKNLMHIGFNLYWLIKVHDYKDNYILIIVKKDLLDKIILEN